MIPAKRAHLYVAATTHAGMKGKNNEDRYAVSAHQLSQDDPTPSLLAVVADGVGGHRAGEVAAELAVEVISREVLNSDASHPTGILAEAIAQASRLIYSQAATSQERQGMSTTCACAWVIADRLYTASVGDSRIYLVRNQTIRQLTTDHTWVQEAIESGALTPEQAQSHPNAHVIRRHLGSQQPVVPDLRLRLGMTESDSKAEANQGVRLQPGDYLLLCSDGLTDLVKDHEILEKLLQHPREMALQELVNLANLRGGHDNITIVTLQVPKLQPARTTLVSRGWRRFAWPVAGLVGLLLLGLLAGGYFWWIGWLQPPPPRTTAPVESTPLQPAGVLPPEPIPSSALPPNLTPSAIPKATASLTPLPASATPIQATYTAWPTNTPSSATAVIK